MTTDTDKLMNPVAQRFKEFCGQEQYEKFLKKLAEGQRVTYWQVQLWERFLRVAGLNIKSDYESVISTFRLEELHIPIPDNEGLTDRQIIPETFIRSIRTTYACDKQSPPRISQSKPSGKGTSSSNSAGITGAVTLGSHQHFVDITAAFDWAGDSNNVIVQDSSSPPLLLGCSEHQAKVFEFSDFMRLISSELLSDQRLYRYLHKLRIRLQNFTTGTLFGKGDEYSISCGYVSPCTEITPEQIPYSFAVLMRDLAADISFGNRIGQKKIEMAFR